MKKHLEMLTMDLAVASSLVLYKFTEGCEDWTEYIELAHYCRKVANESNDIRAAIVQRRVDEFFQRRFDKYGMR